MVEVKEPIFQIDGALAKDYYSNSENIFIVDEASQAGNLCVIYFSSNELYYPNTEASFTNAIVKRDKYEWKNTRFPNASRHIYVRDIRKQWYITGANSVQSSPELLAQKLQQLTEGFDVITIGSSAGGFAAILFGSMMKVKKVYAFNAQLNLNIIVAGSTADIDPILFSSLEDPARSKYFRLDNFVIPSVTYYYFQSAKSAMDIEQYEDFGKKELLKKIGFATSNHGFPFLRHNLKHVLSLTDAEMDTLSKKTHHPFLFAAQIDGFIKTCFIVADAIIKRMRKKLGERMRS